VAGHITTLYLRERDGVRVVVYSSRTDRPPGGAAVLTFEATVDNRLVESGVACHASCALREGRNAFRRWYDRTYAD
jgi:hypothetical protein